MKKPSEVLSTRFLFTPTRDQQELFTAFDDFLLNRQSARQVFLLKGYAGTGKTTVISTLVNLVGQFGFKTLLLAPTGRAAKVMASYSKRKAFTIHKIIYKQTEDPLSGKMSFARQNNKAMNTLFIVDEASMIYDQSEFGSSGLLQDLIQYVFQESSSGNKLLLVGDNAQLPPVHQTYSPALDEESLSHKYGVNVSSKLLTQVTRQEQESGILNNATLIRETIRQEAFKVQLATSQYPDIFKMNSERLEDGLRYAYNKFGVENTAIITRSNKAATMYNQYIRRQINYSETEVDAGDYIMIVKNNYTWLGDDSAAGFLANGEFAEVLKVARHQEMYGHKFVDLTLRLIDYPDQESFEARCHTETLESFAPALSQEEFRNLYQQVMLDYVDASSVAEQMKKVRTDGYLNALQIKFAYALTCHKSQGGQWDAVFVDMGFVQRDQLGPEFMRWLYTAITRAKKELFLVNFPQEFFAE